MLTISKFASLHRNFNLHRLLLSITSVPESIFLDNKCTMLLYKCTLSMITSIIPQSHYNHTKIIQYLPQLYKYHTTTVPQLYRESVARREFRNRILPKSISMLKHFIIKTNFSLKKKFVLYNKVY